MLSISVRPERYSHHLIQESGEFVVNLPTESLVRAIDWCGVKSGRDVDKFATMHLTAAPAAKADNGSIPGEIIAAISAAVASVCGGNAVIRGIKRVSKPAAGSRRGAWGDAGVREHTTPFM
jgi:flavin reductase (DIM6/NTAB) family NADH-FMN oxidoreductase RutF